MFSMSQLVSSIDFEKRFLNIGMVKFAQVRKWQIINAKHN